MLIVDQNVLDDVSRGFSVPSQPKLLLKLLKLMSKPDPDIDAIANCISQDIAISAAVLKTINSALYGLNRTVTDIKMAVSYIGIYGVIMLVTGSLLKKSFDPKMCSIDLEYFWKTTSDIANVAVSIGKKFKPNIATDKCFNLGLFHACGVPVMAMKYNDYQTILDQASITPDLSITVIEEQQYQVNHATIGYFVASSWRLPKEICQIILQYNERNYLQHIDGSTAQDLYAILKLSEHIISMKYSDRASADWAFVEESVLTVLSTSAADLNNTIDELSS